MNPNPLHGAAARFSLLASGLALAAGSVLAQTWPSKAVTMVAPWPAGGPSDFVASQIQNDTAKTQGQTLIVENVGGVGAPRRFVWNPTFTMAGSGARWACGQGA